MERSTQSGFSEIFKRFLISLLALIFFPSCAKVPTDDATSSRYLYVSSGLCYSGAGNTAFTNLTSSNQVYRINLSTGQKDALIADYFSSPAQTGDSPVGLVSADSSHLYVLIDNATAPAARRIEKVEKKASGNRILFSNNTTALSTTLRSLASFSSGDLLISKSTSIEAITSANVRLTKGVSPYVTAPAAPCATSTTLFSKVTVLNNQFIAFIHAAVGQNRIGFVKPSGYSAAGDCTPAQASPVAGAYPVAMAYDSAHTKLIVAYSGNTTATDINSIYVYSLTETASSVTVDSADKIYDAADYLSTYPYLLYGISEMTFDSSTNSLYVATAVSTATTVTNYQIEKFSFDSSKVGTDDTHVLTRSGSTPFYPYGSDTKCISSMVIAD